MREIGIPVYLLRWYKCFLLDRRYCLCVGTSYSKIVRFSLDVPQGSISGPLLFALYLSTLIKEIRTAVTRTVEFAHRLNLWLRLNRNADNSYDIRQAQTALTVVSDWSEKYGVNVSLSKTHGFLYPANYRIPSPPINITYRGTTLAIKDESKMLGVTFDLNLIVDKHVANVTNAAKRKLACISKIIGKDWGSLTGDTRVACLSQVWSILTYACNVWVQLLNEGTLTKLRRMINYMARVIAGLFRPTDINSLYLEANVLDIMKTVDDKTMASTERHRRRPVGDPLRVKALGTTPKVRASLGRPCTSSGPSQISATWPVAWIG